MLGLQSLSHFSQANTEVDVVIACLLRLFSACEIIVLFVPTCYCRLLFASSVNDPRLYHPICPSHNHWLLKLKISY